MKYEYEDIYRIVDNIDIPFLNNAETKILIKLARKEDGAVVSVGMERVCSYTGKVEKGWGGKAYISPWSTEDEIVKKVLGLALAYVEHEVREAFLYKGVRPFGPHVTLQALMSIADQTESRAEKHSPD